VPGRKRERVEVVAGRLHLAVVDHLVPEAEEDVFDVAAYLGRGVERAPAARADRPQELCWKSHVDAL
jgi:hypothetical protein